ncbi:hypothetical protein COO60DRAFT_286321 [Scenedesmus sp. NREL 46B-D3]|nr:hypothetical protein COO60DRAFT_286321 [Scenedesmus sp. NREL 46B-D3]
MLYRSPRFCMLLNGGDLLLTWQITWAGWRRHRLYNCCNSCCACPCLLTYRNGSFDQLQSLHCSTVYWTLSVSYVCVWCMVAEWGRVCELMLAALLVIHCHCTVCSVVIVSYAGRAFACGTWHCYCSCCCCCLSLQRQTLKRTWCSDHERRCLCQGWAGRAL